MGCTLSTEEREWKRRNDEIDLALRKEKQNARNQVRLLLLGAGESGKSTILKQMKLIHDDGYSKEELLAFREVIFSNTIQSMQVVLEAMATLNIEFEHPENETYKAVLLDQPNQIESSTFPHEVAVAIKALWEDAGVKKCVERSSEFQLNDSAFYYFNSVERISSPSYIPTNQDVLLSRIKTTGITESTFRIGDIIYRMFDVGGQRSERKKWIHCFEEVTAILFLVAISEYDQVLAEDDTVNRMEESLTLFDSICNSCWFVKTPIILFLNKIDIFKEKLQRVPLKKYFSNYTGDGDYNSACEYICNRFVSLNHSNQKTIYVHFTCATDTNQMKFVMVAVNDIITQTNLRECGLI